MKKRRAAVLLSALVLYTWVPQTIIGSADVNVYKANNEDLVQAYGEELPLYYEHYMKCGYGENRICHE